MGFLEILQHCCHIFVPGTEENMALTALVPSMSPIQTVMVNWFQRLKNRFVA